MARDGREFAEKGAGAMYWFKVPLGGLSSPEGFRSFLQPALANPQVTKIRFVLDASVPPIRRIKMLCPDLDTDHATESEAQTFLSTASRTMRFRDGTMHAVRIPDAILRVKASEDDSLMYALNTVANQWDSLFQ